MTRGRKPIDDGRKRMAQIMYINGSTPDHIAHQLDVSADTVRKWIKAGQRKVEVHN